MDRARPKGPDYLIIDNFVEIFGIDKADLIDAKSVAEEIKEGTCNNSFAAAYDRCDFLVWLKNLDIHVDGLTAFTKIAFSMTAFRLNLNEKSQDKLGDKTLRIDKEEIVLSRFNGASSRD